MDKKNIKIRKKDMEEKISVIIPIYQVENFLRKCIETIVEQTYQNLEIILVDDGSKDNCPQICDEYARKDERIKVIHKENGGLSDARNVGIENATGDYLFFIDSDDWVEKDILSHLYIMLKENKADIAECQYEKVYQEQDIIENEKEKVMLLQPRQALENLAVENKINNIIICSKLYKSKLFREIRFPKGKIHEDEYTTYKLFYMANKIVVTNLKLYYYRQREGSIIVTKFNPKRLDVIQAYEERLKFYQKKDEKHLYKLEITKFLYILLYCYYHSKKAKFDKQTIKNIKTKYKKVYKQYCKVNPMISKEKVKYGLIYLVPNLVFILPII